MAGMPRTRVLGKTLLRARTSKVRACNESIGVSKLTLSRQKMIFKLSNNLQYRRSVLLEHTWLPLYFQSYCDSASSNGGVVPSAFSRHGLTDSLNGVVDVRPWIAEDNLKESWFIHSSHCTVLCMLRYATTLLIMKRCGCRSKQFECPRLL